MPEITMVEALNLGLHQAMAADDRVVVLGEDVAKTGGVFRVTAGLLDKFGDDRIIDTPLAEAGIVGAAIGMAVYGLLPVVEIQFDVFVYPAFEQIVVQAARYAWRTKGEVPASIVIRIPYGGGVRAPELHSDSPEALFSHVPGLKVVCPTTPQDARDMLVAAIADPDPVIFMEPKRIYRAGRQEVTAELPFELGNGNGVYNSYLTKARVARDGDDLAIITYGATLPLSLETADRLSAEGIEARVIDLRSIFPLDVDAIVKAASECGRALVVHEAPRTAGIGAEVSALIHERAMLDLEAPVGRVTGFDVPFPQFANEDDYLPSVDRIYQGAKKVLSF
ncbi:MAG: pyruvate dehydrogenase component beta subunit [Actinomycetota bacterium]|jgi:pyruvate dehydrogenase E1 component beta subunit|nr:pyruvate dehydrogenase component beta subunit [Actinomycetota bacterium]